jgi:hypothetical protein
LITTGKPDDDVRAALRRHGIDPPGDELKPVADAYDDISSRLEGLRAVLDTGHGYR